MDSVTEVKTDTDTDRTLYRRKQLFRQLYKLGTVMYVTDQLEYCNIVTIVQQWGRVGANLPTSAAEDQQASQEM